ncbi:MAG: MFS transporter [Chitinophagales bacterium]|nr:MFS transporter [Chitinophagales bacterium]
MDRGRERLLLFTLAAINFVHIMDFVIMMPLAPMLMKTLGMKPAQFGMVVSAYTYSAFVSSLLAAPLMDRFDRKKVLLWLFIGFTLGTFACALSDSFWTLLVARAVTGLFGGIMGANIFSIIGDVIPFERRSAAMGLVMGAFSLASALGVPFGLYLAASINWEAPFFLLGGASILVLGFIWFFVPVLRGHLGKTPSESLPDVIVNISREPDQKRALALMGMLVMGQFTIIPMLSTYMVFNVGFTEHQLTWIYLLGGSVTFFTSPYFGRLADRHGNQRVFMVMAIVALVPILLITNLPKVPVYVALIPTTLFFIAIGGRMVPAMGMITATVSPQRRGSFMSINTSVMQLFSGTAALISGLIVMEQPKGHLIHYSYVGFIAVAASIACLFLAKRIQAGAKKEVVSSEEPIAETATST